MVGYTAVLGQTALSPEQTAFFTDFTTWISVSGWQQSMIILISFHFSLKVVSYTCMHCMDDNFMETSLILIDL